MGLVITYTVEGKQNITSYLIGTTNTNGKMSLKVYKYVILITNWLYRVDVQPYFVVKFTEDIINVFV